MRRGNDMIFTKCPQCGGNIAPGSVRCSHCGYSEIPSAAKNSSAALSKCPACGGPIADSATHCPHCGYTEITGSKLSRYRKYDLVQKVLTGFGLVIGVLGVIGVILSGVQLSGTVKTPVLIAAIISSAVDALYPALILIGLGTILGAAWEDK